MTESDERCPCGEPLHYNSLEIKEIVDELVAQLGPTVLVSVGGRSWLVPRHYIALHGLRAQDLPTLGFQEVSEEPPR